MAVSKEQGSLSQPLPPPSGKAPEARMAVALRFEAVAMSMMPVVRLAVGKSGARTPSSSRLTPSRTGTELSVADELRLMKDEVR